MSDLDDLRIDQTRWQGAVDTEEGRAYHRTVGSHRAWSDSGEWCYPSDPCAWCREHIGEGQVWLPAEGTDEHEALVDRLAAALWEWDRTRGSTKVHASYEEFAAERPANVYGDMIRAILAALLEDERG